MMQQLLIAGMAVAAVSAPAQMPAVTAVPSSTAPPARAMRFAAEIAAFPPAPATRVHGATALFIGSSSIRLWNLAHSFPALDPVNRGFGGATVRDVLFYYDRITASIRPAAVIVYVGENDIAEGASSERVAADLVTLLARLRADMPAARIAYLSMKPTPLRWDLWPRMEAVNAALRTSAGKSFDYLDVSNVLLDDRGRPDPGYFRADGLHMNAKGYSLWSGIIRRWLHPAAPVEEITGETVAAF